MILKTEAPIPPTPPTCTGEGAPVARSPLEWLDDGPHLRRHLRELESAIRRRWCPAAEADRLAIIHRLVALMGDDQAGERVQIRAMRCLAAMQASNQGMTRPSPFSG
jgi:hypothetical protein